MASVAGTLGDAVATRISTGQQNNEFSIGRVLTVERSYADWDLPLEDSDRALRVDVVPFTAGMTHTKLTRGTDRFTIPVDIVVRRKFNQEEQDSTTGRIPNSVIDPLVELVEKLFSIFNSKEHLPTYVAAVPDGQISITANPFNKHLRELRQFTGVLRVSFAVTVNSV